LRLDGLFEPSIVSLDLGNSSKHLGRVKVDLTYSAIQRKPQEHAGSSDCPSGIVAPFACSIRPRAWSLQQPLKPDILSMAKS
jgi:hypothetical protein